MFISLSEAQLQMNAMLPLGGKSLRLKLVLLFLFILLSFAELPFEISVVKSLSLILNNYRFRFIGAGVLETFLRTYLKF